MSKTTSVEGNVNTGIEHLMYQQAIQSAESYESLVQAAELPEAKEFYKSIKQFHVEEANYWFLQCEKSL